MESEIEIDIVIEIESIFDNLEGFFFVYEEEDLTTYERDRHGKDVYTV